MKKNNKKLKYNMSVFDIFNEFSELTEICKPFIEESTSRRVFYTDCCHENTVIESGAVLCNNCGIELKKIISYEKDWRYYGDNDNRSGSDPNRCYIRKNEEKNIFSDVESLGFSDKIINMANDIYTQVTKGKIYRGNSRKSLVFSSIFHATKLGGKPYSCEMLREIFKLDRKIVLKGLKHVNLTSPKTSQIRTKQITPVELIEEYASRFDISDDEKSEIVSLYEQIKNKSSIIIRSRPQSVASSMIYYYISTKRGSNNFNIKDYIKRVKLSELTICRLCREISSVVE